MNTPQTSADEAIHDDAGIGDLAPREVLVDVDGPRLFVAQTPDGAELLAYQLADEPTRAVWLVVPTDAATIASLRGGVVALRDALRRPWAWIVSQTHEGSLVSARRIDLAEVPGTLLPAKGAVLTVSCENG